MLEYYEAEVAKHSPNFDWAKRIAFVGAGPGNPFPVWYGADQLFELASPRGLVGRHFSVGEERIGGKISAFEPDVVIICHSNQSHYTNLLPRIRKATSAPVGLWYGDIRPAQYEVPHCVDRLFMCWNKSVDKYDLNEWENKFKAPQSFMMNSAAFNNKIHPFKPDPKFPSVFIGRLYSTKWWAYRKTLIPALKSKVYCGGSKSEVVSISNQAFQIYRNHHFCIATSPAISGLQSDRLFVILSAGGLALVDWFEGLDKLFTHGEHILTFKTHDAKSAAKVMERYIEEPELCSKIRINGWRQQQLKHTTGHRILNMTDNLLTGSDKFWGWLD